LIHHFVGAISPHFSRPMVDGFQLPFLPSRDTFSYTSGKASWHSGIRFLTCSTRIVVANRKQSLQGGSQWDHIFVIRNQWEQSYTTGSGSSPAVTRIVVANRKQSSQGCSQWDHIFFIRNQWEQRYTKYQRETIL
jgi:hypothetical protein